MTRNIYDLADFRIVEFAFSSAERSECILGRCRSDFEACVLASPALAVRAYKSIKVMSADRQLVFQRNSIAEVYSRIDRRKPLAFSQTVHESFSSACVSVRIHAECTESIPVRHYTWIILCFVTRFSEVLNDLV